MWKNGAKRAIQRGCTEVWFLSMNSFMMFLSMKSWRWPTDAIIIHKKSQEITGNHRKKINAVEKWCKIVQLRGGYRSLKRIRMFLSMKSWCWPTDGDLINHNRKDQEITGNHRKVNAVEEWCKIVQRPTDGDVINQK